MFSGLCFYYVSFIVWKLLTQIYNQIELKQLIFAFNLNILTQYYTCHSSLRYSYFYNAKNHSEFKKSIECIILTYCDALFWKESKNCFRSHPSVTYCIIYIVWIMLIDLYSIISYQKVCHRMRIFRRNGLNARITRTAHSFGAFFYYPKTQHIFSLHPYVSYAVLFGWNLFFYWHSTLGSDRLNTFIVKIVEWKEQNSTCTASTFFLFLLTNTFYQLKTLRYISSTDFHSHIFDLTTKMHKHTNTQMYA